MKKYTRVLFFSMSFLALGAPTCTECPDSDKPNGGCSGGASMQYDSKGQCWCVEPESRQPDVPTIYSGAQPGGGCTQTVGGSVGTGGVTFSGSVTCPVH